MRLQAVCPVLLLGPLLLVAACASSSTAGTPNPATPAVSFDGRYQGSIQLTGAIAGADQRQCAVDPHLSLQVTNNMFTYTQLHPSIANTAPGLTASVTSPTYHATIGPDGSITGDSGGAGGTIAGQASATHMSGTINGLACYYSFSADRV